MDGWQRPPRWTGGLPESAQVAAQPRAHPSSLCADSEEGEGGAGAAPSPTASAAAKKGRSVRDPSAAWEKRRPTPPPLRPPTPTPPPPTTVRCCCPCVGAAQHPLRTPPWKRRRGRRACAAPRRLTAVRGPRRPRAQPVGATLRKEYAGCHARPRSDGTSVAHGEWTSTDAIVLLARRPHGCGWRAIDGEGKRWVGTRGRRCASCVKCDSHRISYGRRASPSNRRCT